MSFRRANLIPLVLSTVTLAFGPAFGRPKPVSSEMKRVELTEPVTVNGAKLSPGNYELVIDNGKATFQKNGQTVATAACDWKALPSKSPYDSVTTDKQDVLRQIDFAGSAQALEIK